MVQILTVTDRIWCVRRRSCPGAYKTLGFSPSELVTVLLTHWPNDHSAGAGELKKRLGVSVYYAADEVPFLTRETSSQRVRARRANSRARCIGLSARIIGGGCATSGAG
jgi:glyoxylase-like metal-dependent hydrolase (beta-lactamase superfamily II)